MLTFYIESVGKRNCQGRLVQPLAKSRNLLQNSVRMAVKSLLVIHVHCLDRE